MLLARILHGGVVTVPAMWTLVPNAEVLKGHVWREMKSQCQVTGHRSFESTLPVSVLRALG